MPNCFQLTRKSDLAAGPVSLNKIDEEMCEHFHVACDAKKYYYEWYMTIGFELAMGNSFEKQRTIFNDKRTLEIVEWLDANFVSDAFVQIGK